MLKTRRISFGGSAAIVSSTALICGLDSINAAKPIIVSALLIAAIADNLTDTLSIHIYQESENLNQRNILIGTISNFTARFLLSASFIGIAILFPPEARIYLSIIWGTTLLSLLTLFVARERQIAPLSEIVKHLIAAAIVVAASIVIPPWISTLLN